MSRVLPQLIIFSYHKSGTTLFLQVMTKVTKRLGLTLANHYGMVDQLDPEPDVVLLPHSVLRTPLDRPYRAIRLIRDPRDIWVSGYLYHRHCDEEWCVNTNMDPMGPIQWPQVDHSVNHWSQDWKRRYLGRLCGRSYQQNLLERSLTDGLDFELEGYTGCTLATMREWPLNKADALDVKLEDVMADFDGTMRRIFNHFCFTAVQTELALEVARSEDVRRMDDAAIAERPQINSRTISKWRDALSVTQIERFEISHGDLIRDLGYETIDAQPVLVESDAAKPIWSRLAERPARSFSSTNAETTQDLCVTLSADGAAICATVISKGMYTFVVPRGKQQLRLESQYDTPAKSCILGQSSKDRFGVRVTEVTIRSATDDVVMAADDPRLTTGWHDAERSGTTVWRWTDGSAEIPWSDVCGPAIVTIRCITFIDIRFATMQQSLQPQGRAGHSLLGSTVGELYTVAQ